jgi:hypothetical protein
MASAAPATEPRPIDEATIQAMERELLRRYPNRPRCRRCHRVYDLSEESGWLRKGWCFTCEWNWLEPRVERLVRRIGRKAALVAIRRVTQ